MLKIVAPTMHLVHTKSLYWCVDVCDMNDTHNLSNLYIISFYYLNSLSNNFCKYLSALKSCLFACFYNSISTYLHTRYAGHSNIIQSGEQRGLMVTDKSLWCTRGDTFWFMQRFGGVSTYFSVLLCSQAEQDQSYCQLTPSLSVTPLPSHWLF